MAIPPAPSSSPRRRIARAARVLLITAAIVGAGGPALAAAQPPAGHGEAGRPPVSGSGPGRAVPAGTALLAAAVTPAAPGGVCQVPGIGDIGGLLGLCAQGSSGLVGDLNNICEPSLPQPEQATGGIDAMIEPPAAEAGGKTLYDNYGVAGQFWAAHGLQCSDMTSLIGNNVAGMVFDAAKAMDRVTITVYQSAAGDGILAWLRGAVDRLISALGNAIYFPYLAPVVILGAIWLAWQGLIRKRATRTIEGTLWMVVACVAAIALIGRPAMFTGVGTAVSNGVTQVLNAAFSKLPAPGGGSCLPVQPGDPQSVTGSYAFTSANGLVDANANELWSVLVCKPWLDGELGTTEYAATGSGPQTVVNAYGRQLLWAQAIAANEAPTSALIQAKQATYAGIASSIQASDPAVYPLFQGDQWTTRLEIAFAAVLAALVAGLLILLIALTLIVLKLGFLLLLVMGPLFLIVGTHPGFGRIIAIRWFEMLVGVLMKQVAIAVVLSVLLYCYSLIMGTSDAVLPWALKILMIALVTAAVFIYRKPFQHLFSAVGYGAMGSQERAEYTLREAGATFRRSTLDAAALAIPGMAGYRAARWARRNPAAPAAAAAGGAAGGIAAGAGTALAAGTAGAAAGTGTEQAATADAFPSRLRPEAPPAADTDGETAAASRPPAGVAAAAGPAHGVRATLGTATPEAGRAAGGSARAAPPLDLPPRGGTSRRPGRPGRPGRPAAAPGGGPAGAAGSRPAEAAGSGPAWPYSGWTAAGPRQRSAARTATPARTAPPEAAAQAEAPAEGRTGGDQAPMPFWLRPVRRDR